MLRLLIVAWAALGSTSSFAAERPGAVVLWAWERPEDLRTAGPDVEVAALVGFVELSGDTLWSRGRRFPLLISPGAKRIALVHVQIEPRHGLEWTPQLRARAAAAVLAYARGFQDVQVDFEARASRRTVLLDLLGDVRAGLAPGARLSMTALASWCETESWIQAAPVDEIVPMVFRMGPGGDALKAKLAAGGDFANPKCRLAIGVSVSAPLARMPDNRRVYVFNPRSWTPGEIAAVLKRPEP